MTVVIADSSPLNDLALVGSVDVLHRLYGAVVVPKQVIAELLDQQPLTTFVNGRPIVLTGSMCVRQSSVTMTWRISIREVLQKKGYLVKG